VKHNLVLVIWRDTREIDSGSWHDKKEVETTASSVIHSVGWIIEENTVDIKISADIPADIDDTDVGRTTVIPRGCVEEIINVRCEKEDD
tara:strand:- start:165 stop:431 length:267 start_codon:yes stop_codon:yes gene_type:complete